jgi:hypothetical protein
LPVGHESLSKQYLNTNELHYQEWNLACLDHRVVIRIGWLQGRTRRNLEAPAANARCRLSPSGHPVEPASDALQGFWHAWQVRTVHFETVLVNPESLQPFRSVM